MTRQVYVLGVDVAKHGLDCAGPDERTARRVANDSEAIADLVADLDTRRAAGQDVLVVVEASGGQERRLRAALDDAGIPVHVGNAKRIRDYARALGWMAKTDGIDAVLLRRYGEREQPRPTPPLAPERRELAQLLDYRAQVQAEITARSAQLRGYDHGVVRRRADAALARLRAERAELSKLIAERMNAPPSKPAHDMLRSCPGLGPITAASLLAHLPELGQLLDKRIASLAGLAPFACDSGQLKGRRMVRGRRTRVRETLYMPAAIAGRHNPELAAMRDRLTARNKPPKVVRTALMRKLLLTLNAMMRKQTTWTPTEHHQLSNTAQPT